MKLAVIGATGNVGQRIVDEALRRGHQVTAIARHPESMQGREGVTAVQGDVSRPEELARVLAGHDAVISSIKFQDFRTDDLLAAVRASGVKRLLVVGGAGSLENEEGIPLIDTPGFPDFVKVEAEPGRACLNQLKGVTDLDWTFLSPSMFFGPGERTGKFRLGKDRLLVAEDGKSSISYEDYAIALLDEVESPQHVRQRFTVGY